MAKRPAALLLLPFAAVIGGVYTWRLADAPIYLYHDEVLFAIEAHRVSTTLRDLNGQLLPLYFNLGYYWCSPGHIYLTALLLKVVHISDTAIRIPSVAIG